MHLSELSSPKDIKDLSYEELDVLAGEIRQELIQTVSQRGGHLASNLGVVELTLALHRVYDMPKDKIVFDVGHQSYVHKLITGRNHTFQSLRTFGGIAGFPKRSESEYDVFETGHASTAISAVLGMARARDYLKQDYQTIAVVGDGALTGGMCYEALNDAGSSKTRLTVILNDNEMSINRNVGALARHMTDLRLSHGWSSTKERVKSGLRRVPGIGQKVYRFVHLSKGFIKSLFVDEGFFTSLGFQYFGPIDGHDIRRMEHTLRLAADFDGPCIIHVLTRKGYGYDKAEQQPEKFHGVPPFYVETGDSKSLDTCPGFGEVMADTLTEMARNDPRIVGITAAMLLGTCLNRLEEALPGRTLDVGIAEEHATTMAAGLASAGMRPYFAVYASFFQRAYDQTIHDVCMQELPVIFLLDRAGLSGHDGETHHGIFDFAEVLPMPNMTVLAPRDLQELKAMMQWTANADGPVCIRYGRQGIDMSGSCPYHGFRPGKWERLTQGGDVTILAVGSMVTAALDVAKRLRALGFEAEVVNCSTVKPLDEDMLLENALKPVVTMEEHMLTGGFGSYVSAFCTREHLPAPMLCFGIQDRFVQHGSRNQLLKYLGLTPEQMTGRIAVALQKRNRRKGGHT